MIKPTIKPTHYVINLTLDNQSSETCKFNVSYGLDNGSTQTEPILLTSTKFETGSSIQSFTIDNPKMIYFLFTLLNTNMEIAVDTGHGSFQIWGDTFNHTMKSPTENISFLVKNK